MRKLGCLNIPKSVRYFAIEAFGALQNTVSINEAKQVFEELCHLFLNEENKKVQEGKTHGIATEYSDYRQEIKEVNGTEIN